MSNEEDLFEFLSRVAPPSKSDKFEDPDGQPRGFLDSPAAPLSKKEQKALEKKEKEEAKRQEKEAKAKQKEQEKKRKQEEKEAKRTPSTGSRTPSNKRTPTTGKRTPNTGKRTPSTASRSASTKDSRQGSTGMEVRSAQSSDYTRTRKRMNKVEVSDQQIDIDESFDKDVAINLILHDAVARQLFFEFLQMEHSEENLLFWEAVEGLKEVAKPTLIISEALKIWHEFLSLEPEAPHLINIPAKVHKPMARMFGDRKNYHEIHKFMFNSTQQSIYQLMKTDSLLRFMKGDLFRRWMVVQRADREREERLQESITIHEQLQSQEHTLVDATSATTALEDLMDSQKGSSKIKKKTKANKAERSRVVDPMELLMMG
mmetsp:Transcript_14826/g.37676  ORF Transcript_14826/g.37676 Transcript_14826/m.37676 type:complete len:372 (-) Transcript_14826:58-1173(-)|eukprot:CAMPEP_0177648994 /NCGR_PEP_ID=MMETSP0447-20121125/11130_1 /TAXON_ID=0 /ORGANISM="Stygamoeba regulata, Strain BSH-02190019" /LENGTH=371 /DNA_ID=CAMNT_0019151683 /DNA_START=289 /DNA_END=1404 /DNA_ORIENTATION=-